MTSAPYPEEIQRAGRLEWAVAGRPHPGERRSGDAFLVQARRAAVLLAVVDGVGHGPEAEAAAEAAVRAIEATPAPDVAAAMEAAHAACARTRGAAVSVAVLREAADGALGLEWAGVGNVEALVVRPGGAGVERRRLVSQNGVVGYRCPPTRTSSCAVAPGHLLVWATDGIAPDFGDALSLLGAPDRIARDILEAHGLVRDDALVLVARARRDTA